jgi:hypothetical protein
VWAFYFIKTENYFFSDFSILAFNAANIYHCYLLKVAGVLEELDEVFSVAVFTFSSSSRKIAV